MKTLALLLSLFSFSAYAETAISVTIEATSPNDTRPLVKRVAVNTHLNYTVRFARFGEPPAGPVSFDFDVPGEVQSVMTVDNTVQCTGTHPIHCTMETVPNVINPLVVNTRLSTPGNAVATVTISPASLSPGATYTVEVVDLPSLYVAGSFSSARLEPSQPANFVASLASAGKTAHDVTLTMTLPDGGTITAVDKIQGDVDFTCQVVDATTATCHADEMPFGGFMEARVQFLAPVSHDGGTIRAQLHATADEPDFDESHRTYVFETRLVRHMVVTNTNDEGAGSLRQAILDSNTLCAIDPCVIDFALPIDAPPVIHPRTQLPDITGVVKIDGLDAANVVIDGSLQAEGNGLVMREGCEIQILNLTVRNFANSAVEARRGDTDLSACNNRYRVLYPNTVLSGNVLTNSHRSLVVMDTGTITISHNVMSGNRRSGIFAQRVFYLDIDDNVIEDNGASGIFLDVGSRDYVAGGADVTNNTIANNAEWGICRTRSGEVAIIGNRIYGNSHQGIDVDLDFETPNEPQDLFRPPNAPVLFSATYDAAANATVVRGNVTSRNNVSSNFHLEVFASSSLTSWGHAQGETLVLTKDLPFMGPDGPGDFEVTVPGDLRGQWITATNSRYHIIGFAKPPKVTTDSHLFSIPGDTSEFSNALQVQ